MSWFSTAEDLNRIRFGERQAKSLLEHSILKRGADYAAGGPLARLGLPKRVLELGPGPVTGRAKSTWLADNMKPVSEFLSKGHRRSYAVGAGIVGAGAMVSRQRSGRAIDQSNGTPRGIYGR